MQRSRSLTAGVASASMTESLAQTALLGVIVVVRTVDVRTPLLPPNLLPSHPPLRPRPLMPPVLSEESMQAHDDSTVRQKQEVGLRRFSLATPHLAWNPTYTPTPLRSSPTSRVSLPWSTPPSPGASLNAAYAEIVHWRKTRFKIPLEKLAKTLSPSSLGFSGLLPRNPLWNP